VVIRSVPIIQKRTGKAQWHPAPGLLGINDELNSFTETISPSRFMMSCTGEHPTRVTLRACGDQREVSNILLEVNLFQRLKIAVHYDE
jgi:hypothetical protein